ncbi:transmembrane receptor protein tyrosine kinase signaling pathway [Branchiostoma belcheri]|nr:transmembrane receptor protein tyrosine kinase signaling pathway [Branchiostoma belcheri]
MRMHCERYDTAIEIKPMNGSVLLHGSEPSKLGDGTLYTGSLPSSFGRKSKRTRSYYRSHDSLGGPMCNIQFSAEYLRKCGETNASAFSKLPGWVAMPRGPDPSVDLTCFQLQEDMSKSVKPMGTTKTRAKRHQQPPPAPSGNGAALRVVCNICMWLLLLVLTGFTAWLYTKMKVIQADKDKLQSRVQSGSQQLEELQDRTRQLLTDREDLQNRINKGARDILQLQDSTQNLQTQLDNATAQLNRKDRALEGIQQGLASFGDCNRADDCNIRDCSDVKARNSLDGVYPIWPDNYTSALYVYCDMTTAGGGWTVVQRRQDGSVNFFRNWTAYKYGFGNLNGELWLGTQTLYTLLSQRLYKLRIDLEDWDGVRRYAEYDNITLGPESDNYRLTLGTYRGNAGDSMTGENGTMGIFTRNLNNMQFSTKDRDNDNSMNNKHCAQIYKGGWWYNDCYNANLNGRYYFNGRYSGNVQDGIEWEYRKRLYSVINQYLPALALIEHRASFTASGGTALAFGRDTLGGGHQQAGR